MLITLIGGPADGGSIPAPPKRKIVEGRALAAVQGHIYIWLEGEDVAHYDPKRTALWKAGVKEALNIITNKPPLDN